MNIETERNEREENYNVQEKCYENKCDTRAAKRRVKLRM